MHVVFKICIYSSSELKVLKLIQKKSYKRVVRRKKKITTHIKHQDLSRRCGRGGSWRQKWERRKAGASNGKLPLRTCPRCSVPEPYRSPDWALVPAKTGPKAEY
jgi:hypothetical protein